jgi:hypothetical protein
MLKYSIKFVAPGHGTLIEDPHKEIQRLIDHRLGREKKVFSALEQMGQSGLDELVPIVYDDVDPSLHQWAALSLSAHLIKLQADGKATENKGAWSASSI